MAAPHGYFSLNSPWVCAIAELNNNFIFHVTWMNEMQISCWLNSMKIYLANYICPLCFKNRYESQLSIPTTKTKPLFFSFQSIAEMLVGLGFTLGPVVGGLLYDVRFSQLIFSTRCLRSWYLCRGLRNLLVPLFRFYHLYIELLSFSEWWFHRSLCCDWRNFSCRYDRCLFRASSRR